MSPGFDGGKPGSAAFARLGGGESGSFMRATSSDEARTGVDGLAPVHDLHVRLVRPDTFLMERKTCVNVKTMDAKI